ncbi:glycosyltransferase [Nonomuraea sp. NPDC049684]|uniref:glycosyltransferase n=1 Tax=unclassified Nonomuraea TaxID=2593643 RepID=UPI0037A76025
MTVPRIRGNDFGVLDPPELGAWEPELAVTVVIPAHDRQETLDLTLAALSAQSYPAHLLDVIVVDDGSATPIRLPELVPGGTKLISSPPGGWGRAWAVQAGLDAAAGDVVLVLDADMVPHRRHVEAQLRWHHLAPYVVVLGWIDFTSGGEPPTPEQVVRALDAGAEDDLFPLSPHRHDWAERIIHDHDGLRTASGATAARVHVGATASYPAALLRSIGGLDTSLVLAEDTELGYRLVQAGAVFVPEPQARAWHVGLPTAMRDVAALKRYNDPYVADRVPYRRYLRTDPGRQWLVPYVEAVVTAGGYEDTRATADALLASSIPDVRLTLTGPWAALPTGRRSPLRDPDLDLRLLQATFEHDPRVRLAAEPPQGPPAGTTAPFRLTVPPGWTLSPGTLERLIAHLDEHDLGSLCLALDETPQGVVAARLDRTAALSRAALVATPGDHPDDLIDALYGLEWADGASWGLRRRPDVYPPRRPPVAELALLAARHEKDLTLHRRRVAALRAEIAQLRREAAKNGRDASRWREKAESWRREAVRLARQQDRTVLKRAVRRVRDLAFPAH